MQGFFEEETTEIKQSDCFKCGLYKTCQSPKMKSTGKGKKKILVVAEAPGRTEDERGVQLVGEAGQILRNALKKYDIDLDRDCWKTNAVCCRPPKNRTPTKKEIKCCKPRLIKTINKRKPHLIILLGGVALESFLMNKFAGTSGGINKWRGFIIPDQQYKAWIAPTYHPSFILRSRGDEMLKSIFEKDIGKALKNVNKKVPIEPEYKIKVLTPATAKECAFPINKGLLAFDYETTGLKPYREGHEIVCCAFSFWENTAWVFDDMSGYKDWWKKVLKNKSIKKTAHNLKFEHIWGREIFNTRTNGWKWDSMVASHVLDNRSGITGLKFQAYVNFGIEDYSSHLDRYLKTTSSTEFNKVKEAPRKELLQYCAMDALLQFKLAKKQQKQIRRMV